jgi:hypothetical protein
MKDVREVIGNLKNNIKTRSRNGYEAIANTAAQLKSRLRRISTKK